MESAMLPTADGGLCCPLCGFRDGPAACDGLRGLIAMACHRALTPTSVAILMEEWDRLVANQKEPALQAIADPALASDSFDTVIYARMADWNLEHNDG